MTHRLPVFFATLGSAALLAGAAQAQDSPCGAAYEMQRGDTLYDVTQQCRVGLSRVMELNPELNPRSIPVGREIRLAAETSAEAGRESGDGADYDSDSARDDAAEGGNLQARSSYRVQDGDTPYGIAQRLGISLMELFSQNPGLDPFDMAIGDVLDVPTGDRTAGFSVEPHSGPPGAEVSIDARNLRPDDWVTIGAGPAASEWRAIEQAQIARDGSLATTVHVPDWAEPGDRLTFVVDTDRGVTLKSGDYRVVAPDGEDGRDRIALEGRVSEGVECHTLKTPDGDIWSITSNGIPFTAGEYVEVTGTRADMSYCQQGVGTLSVTGIEEIAPPKDPATNTPVKLDRAELVGPWTAKGGDCRRPDFDVSRYPGGGLAVETSLDGAARTGDVHLRGQPAFKFDQGGGRFDIESRGEGELAVIPTSRAHRNLGGMDLGGDGTVFVRCPA